MAALPIPPAAPLIRTRSPATPAPPVSSIRPRLPEGGLNPRPFERVALLGKHQHAFGWHRDQLRITAGPADPKPGRRIAEVLPAGDALPAVTARELFKH